MDSNWNAAQSGAATGPSFGVGPDSNANLDWRSQLQPDTRQRFVNKMMDTLKRHIPVLVPEDLSKLEKIAVQLEEQIYSAATCQDDYLRKIAEKLISVERKTRINPGQQPQQLMSQNQMLYHQQPLAMRHKMQQKQHQQQTQMQMSPALAGGSGMMSAVPAGGMQQSQLNSVQQQPVGQGALFQQQPLMRQQQQQPQQSQPMMQNPTRPMQQTNNVTDLQQQRLKMQRNQLQQSQMLNQQNQLQQSQMQQNQLQPNQMQQNQMLNQQMMLGQQQNLLLGSGGECSMNKMQKQMQMQTNAGLQQQQPQHQQHLLSQLQSQQQQLPQQQQLSMMQQREMQMPPQQMQGSPALLQTQDNNAIDPQRQQQQQFIPQQQLQQQQRVPQDIASSPASMDSASQTGHQGDWQEEIYQRTKYLKDTYFPDLREVHQKVSIKLSQLDSIVLPKARGQEQIEKMKHYKMVLEYIMSVLQLGKHSMQRGFKDKLSLYEKQILSILQNFKKVPQQQFQAGARSDQPHFPALQQTQPGLQSQQLQQQPQQMDNQNQLQQQLSTSAMPQSKNLGMPNALQKGMQNTLQLDQLQASGMRFGSLQQGAIGPTKQNTMNPPQMVGSGAARSSSIMPHTVTMAGMQANMSSAQVLKPQQEHQAQQIQPQQRMMPTQQQTQQRYLQQGAIGPTMQNTMNPPHMVGSGAAISSSIMSDTVPMAGMQTNMSSAQVLKPQQEHQAQQIQPQQCMMPTQQQMQQRYMQQGAMDPTMQNTMNRPQMVGSGSAISSSIMPHTVTMAEMQTNMSSSQVLKPQQEQQEQQIQPQQRLMQQKQQQQQLGQQNQMQQLSEPSDPADLKSRQGASGMKSGSMYQQHYPGMEPRNGYSHSQLKPGSNPPISSPQNVHSSSPQISHPSPQVDKKGLIPPTQLKSGTPLQAAASPVVPSPSPSVITSPMIDDTKLGAGLMHNSAADQAGQPLPANSARTGQMGQPQAELFAVGTPGISASHLPAEFSSPEVGQSTILSIQVPESEKPIEKLAQLMRTMPQNQLSVAVKDIASVVRMVDSIPGSALGNGSRAAIGDDLVAMTKCRLQAKNLALPEGVAGTSGRASPPTKKSKRDSSAMPFNSNYNDGLSRDAVSFTDDFNASGRDASEMQSTSASSTKGFKSEMHHALLEELREINIRLIDTELTLNEEDADYTAEAGERIIVKCTYKAITLSPALRAHFISSQLSPILPLRLLIPAGYPKCSPVILDKHLDEQRDIDDCSTRAQSKFNSTVRGLSQPMSLKEIAHAWDTIARKVIQEYAEQFGGGSFFSRIKWQTINPEAPYVII